MPPKSTRLYVPALAGVYDSTWRFAELVLRLAAGLMFLPHALWKVGYFSGPGLPGFIKFFDKVGYSPGAFWGPTILGIEIVGGVLLAIGLFTRPIALILFIEMLVITHFHWPRGFFFNAQGGGYEYPMMWAAVLLYFVIRGGGDWSVDAKLKKEF